MRLLLRHARVCACVCFQETPVCCACVPVLLHTPAVLCCMCPCCPLRACDAAAGHRHKQPVWHTRRTRRRQDRLHRQRQGPPAARCVRCCLRRMVCVCSVPCCVMHTNTPRSCCHTELDAHRPALALANTQACAASTTPFAFGWARLTRHPRAGPRCGGCACVLRELGGHQQHVRACHHRTVCSHGTRTATSASRCLHPHAHMRRGVRVPAHSRLRATRPRPLPPWATKDCRCQPQRPRPRLASWRRVCRGPADTAAERECVCVCVVSSSCPSVSVNHSFWRVVQDTEACV
jgi:hypothetical protein